MKIETLKSLQDRSDEYFSGSGENWKQDLITHYKTMIIMLQENRCYSRFRCPDYKGVIDDHYYKYYKVAKISGITQTIWTDE